MKKQIIYVIGLWMISLTVYGQIPHIITEGDVRFSDGQITGYTSGYVSIIIPTYLNGQAVTSIGSNAFSDKNLTSIEIPNSVTSIGSSAFSNNSLTNVEIPSSVTFIGDRAFSTNNLTSVVMPNSVTFIGDRAFSTNNLTSVDIPNTVTYIGVLAFIDNSLTEVTIPNSVIYIGARAFDGNTLTSFNLPQPIIEGAWNEGTAGNPTPNLTSLFVFQATDYSAVDADFLFEDGEIKDYFGPGGVVTIPSMIDGQTVISVGRNAFQANGLLNVVIPNTVTTIMNEAFAYNSLNSVDIPNSVTTMGFRAFSFNEMTAVNIGSSVKNIGNSVFRYNNLTSVTIPNSVKTITSYAFSDNSLTEVTIPNSVTYIGARAFNENTLTSFILPEPTMEGAWNEGTAGNTTSDLTITYIYEATDYTAVDADFLFIDGEIQDYYGPGGGLIIPSIIDGQAVTSIGSSVFNGSSLTSIDIPNTVTSIGNSAFNNNSLTLVNIPDAVVFIGSFAFANNSLTSVDLSDFVVSIGANSFWNNSLTSVEIPNSVTYIGSSTFENNSLTSIVISNSVAYIGRSAFKSNNLTSVDIPNSVISIESSAFKDNSLASVEIPNSVNYIGSQAFGGNTLTSFILPEPTIDGAWNQGVAGSETSNLGTAYIYEVTDISDMPVYTAVDSDFLFEDGEIQDYYGPRGAIIIPSVIDGQTVTAIGFGAFISNGLTSIDIPNSVTTIGRRAFDNNSLTSVDIPNSVTNIEESAFFSNGLTTVNISNSVVSIGESAFEDNSLNSVVIPNSVTNIGISAFENNSLTSVEIPNSVVSIGEDAFSANSLTNIDLPSSVVFIGGGAFYANGLTSVSIPNSVTYIGRSAFQANSLTNVVLSNSVEFIGAAAFRDNNLTSLDLPNSVGFIGDWAFQNNSLTSIDFPNSLVYIGASAFQNNSLTSFVLPQSSVTGFEIDGWFSSGGTTIASGEIASNLNWGYSLDFTQNNSVVISVLIENRSATLSVSGDITKNFTETSSVNFFVDKGSNITLMPEATGYEFTPESASFTDMQENISQVFTASLLMYSISYENAGTHVNPLTYTIESGEIVLSAADKDGYVFEGWYTEAEFINAVTSIAAGSTGDLILHAKYSADVYAITYELGGGTQNNPLTYTIESEEIVLSAADKDGYVFEGWYTEAEFINAVTSIAAGSTGDLTLYAKYSADVYAITYELDGGMHDNPLTYTMESEEIVLSAADKDGYVFEGWYTETEFINAVTSIAAGSAGDLTLYAKYSAEVYAITYELEGGTHDNPLTYTIESEEIVLSSADKDGYVFEGWYTEVEFINAVTSIAAGSTGDLTLYAKYKLTQTITFEPIADKLTIDAAFDLEASSSSGLAVSYTSSDESVATINGTIVTIVGAGNTNITASQIGNELYSAAQEVTQELLVNKANQEITIESIDDKILNAVDFEVVASTTSDLELTYEVLSGPATNTGNFISLTGEIGNVEIQVSQSGNNKYNATTATTTFEVLPDPCEGFAATATLIQNVACNGGSDGSFEVNLINGTAPFTYTIGGEGQDNGLFENLSVGSYEITVTDANGCSATTTATITEPDALAASATVLQNVDCKGGLNGSLEASAIGGIAPYSYSLAGANQDEGLFESLSAGSYDVTITDANGCSATATVEITEPEALEVTAETTDSNSILGNGSISLTVSGGTGNYSYDWNNGATSANLTDLGIGEYTVSITDEAGCSITESYTIGGVTANSEAFKLNIYPNPVINQVQVVHGANVSQISLIDANGKIISQQKTEGDQTQLEMKALPAGMYFIRLDDGKMKRIIKE